MLGVRLCSNVASAVISLYKNDLCVNLTRDYDPSQ